MSIGTNIKRRRYELKMTQQDLADAMGYKSKSTIAKIESGENDVSHAKLQRIAQILDTTVHCLINGQEISPCSTSVLPNYSANLSTENKNIVLILAGGKSSRNQQSIPNQFINVLGKPVIIYCLEVYQKHPAIDDIYVVCLKGWENILSAYARQYKIDKLRGIIQAGATGVMSVRNGISELYSKYNKQDVVILQESTRPLITEEMISKILNQHKLNGSIVTCEPMRDQIMFELDTEVVGESQRSRYLDRNRLVAIQSPEVHSFEHIVEAFRKTDSELHKPNETCFAMMLYNLGYELHFFEGSRNNIKIVRQEDISILNALLKGRE